jgi:hypothetical protein
MKQTAVKLCCKIETGVGLAGIDDKEIGKSQMGDRGSRMWEVGVLQKSFPFEKKGGQRGILSPADTHRGQ